MSSPAFLKKPKLEREEESNGSGEAAMADENEAENSRLEQEEALVALIEHRTNEVQHLRQRIAYYKSQLEQAEKKLEDSESKLARLRGRDNGISSKKSLGDNIKNGKAERRSASPTQVSEASENQPQSRPRLVIPAVNPKISHPIKMAESGMKASSGSSARASPLIPIHTDNVVKVKEEKYNRIPSEQEVVEIEAKGAKRKFEQQEHQELVPLIQSCSSPCTIRCSTASLISSQHKRKLRSLVLCPTNDQLFVTSALDGVVNLWQVQARGSSASLLSSTDCVSQKQRRWPEDIAWHPDGNSLLSVYTADGGESQISVMNLNKRQQKTRVSFLEEKPHIKGIINNVVFMPWEKVCFATAGSDHGVVLWTERDEENQWKPKVLHRSMHSSAVMGVAGMQQKQIIVSVGADKRIIGFDIRAQRADYKHQIESKCMSVLPNPCDFNLFMVQTGTPERQLRLFDIRLRQTEIHAFGWKQEASESQSALINQAWSPDGLYLTSGSADPVIHIFDIRYNARKPSQSVRAHQKRVFKAAWHHNLPLLISISSDLNIGLHKIT